MSLGGFAEAIEPGFGAISRQAISQWEQGQTNPDSFALVKLYLRTNDWRAEFASECLQQIDPQLLREMEMMK